MNFHKYQHVERLNTSETEGIEFGEVWVFPKIDGSCGSVWSEDGVVKAGSRNRVLSLEKDNQSFYSYILTQDNIKKFLEDYPDYTLYGEWLIPHSLKTYRENVWRQFYVFDVIKEVNPLRSDTQETFEYIPYDIYSHLMEEYDINYIPAICSITNPSTEQLVNQIDKNNYLIEDGQGVGEGIVIKNYSFRNKYGRITWAKIVTSEFKEKHVKVMGPPKLAGQSLMEQEIAEKYITKALCEKTLAKIKSDNNGDWQSKMIPRLLNTIYHDFIQEESWNIIKKFKPTVINFKILQKFVMEKIKTHLPEIF